MRAAAVAVLALALLGDVWNAATVRGRVTEAVLGSEAERAPLYETASWCAAALCAVVVLGVVLRARGIARTPRPLSRHPSGGPVLDAECRSGRLPMTNSIRNHE
jgi:hypothetical protein